MDFSRQSFHRSLSSSSQGPALSMSGSLYRKGTVQRLGAAPSVYGGAGGHGTRISVSKAVMSYGGDLSNGSDLFGGNGKLAMQNLNLGEIMNEMRQRYEVLAQKNLQEAKEQFERQSQTLQQQVTVNTEELKGFEVQVTELRRTYQNLEIELQSHLSMKESLERNLEDVKARYASQLAAIQEMLSSLEAQLMQIRSDTERQNQEHNILLDIKTRLEQEIATYRRLLEGEDIKTTEYQLSTLEMKDIKKTRKIKTVVEEVVDGKVVSSEVKEIEESV